MNETAFQSSYGLASLQIFRGIPREAVVLKENFMNISDFFFKWTATKNRKLG
jgi:hypothetical protein